MVAIASSGVGAVSDESGGFAFSASVNTSDHIEVSAIGYEDYFLQLDNQSYDSLEIKLKPTILQVQEIIVKSSRRNYRRKGNPAVELMQRVIDRKKSTDPRHSEHFNYNRYEKIVLAFHSFKANSEDNFMRKRFKFIGEHVDTCDVINTPILPLSLKELSEDIYYKDGVPHTYVNGIRRFGIDDKMGLESIQSVLDALFGQIDVRDGDIELIDKKFVSPLSAMAVTFYRFHILDTVTFDGQKYTNLFFSPANRQSLGFVGHLYIKADSSEAIHRLSMQIPDDIDLNFVNAIRISQEFEQREGYTVTTKDDLLAELSILPVGRSSLYGRRIDTYNNFSFSPPPDSISLKGAANRHVSSNAQIMPDSYWYDTRHIPLTAKQDSIDEMITRMERVPFYRFVEGATAILVSGYIPTTDNILTSKFNLGLINSFVSNNGVEGWRVKFGGTTTPQLSQRLFAKGYAAYGFADKKPKYLGEVEYSFIDKHTSTKDFPIHSVAFHHSYDVFQPGLEFEYGNRDNLWRSISRQTDTLMSYKRNTEFRYHREHRSGFSYKLLARHYTDTPGRFFKYKYSDTGKEASSITMFETEASIRYAPDEKIYQTVDGRRRSIVDEVPIISLSHNIAHKGVFGSEYQIQKTEFTFTKAQWLSLFGKLELSLKAGKIWDKAPYPFLDIPNADLSYSLHSGSFSLMNPMEFVSDEYIYFDLTYQLNGLIVSRLPLIRKLKLREIVTFKGLYGKLSDKNNPNLSSGLYSFPNGTGPLGKDPYMEVSVGFDNILTVLKLDYVWRLSYLDRPDIEKGGLRISAGISF